MECRATIFKGDVKMHIIDKSLVELSAFRSHLSLFLGAIEKANLLGVPFFTLRTMEMMIDVTQVSSSEIFGNDIPLFWKIYRVLIKGYTLTRSPSKKICKVSNSSSSMVCPPDQLRLIILFLIITLRNIS